MLSQTAVILNRRITSVININYQKVSRRSIHALCRISTVKITRNSSLELYRYSPVIGLSFVRAINTDNQIKSESILNVANKTIESSTKTTETLSNVAQETATTNILESIPVNTNPVNLLDKIPDAPPLPPPEVLDTLVGVLAEPTFKELGLGSWWPSGIMQQLFEYGHVTWGIPWWGTIVIGTVIIRTLMTPLIIMGQRNAAAMHNTLPVLQKHQAKISEAKATGDNLAMAINTRKMLEFMKKENCNPAKSMIVPCCQAPVFISFFFALKKMADLPVESMKQGGLFWFENLTIPDPYYLLPIITSGTLAIILKLGIEGPQLTSLGMLRYVVQALPLVILPFTINFPAAIALYWTTTNIFTMVQVSVLKIPKLRILCKIPERITHLPNTLAPQKKFKEGFQEAWRNSQLAREMQERDQIDNVQFNKAGRGPISKTYRYNPVNEPTKAKIMAKKN